MTTGEQELACEPKKLASLEKMPDVIWVNKGTLYEGDNFYICPKDKCTVSQTKYFLAEPVDELLKQARRGFCSIEDLCNIPMRRIKERQGKKDYSYSTFEHQAITQIIKFAQDRISKIDKFLGETK